MKKSHTFSLADVSEGTIIDFNNRQYLVTYKGKYGSTLLDILTGKILSASFYNAYCTIILDGMTIEEVRTFHPEFFI